VLKQRLLTAAVLGALLLVVLLALPAWATAVAITLAVAIGAWEWSAFVSPERHIARVAFVATIALGSAALWFATPGVPGEQVLFAIAIGWWVVAFAWVAAAPARVSRVAAACAGLLTLIPAWFALMHLRLDFERGAEWILYLLLLVAAADSGAFFAGRRFGRVRLAPRVSPGKTWEGALGGMLVALAAAAAGAWWFAQPLAAFLALSAAVVAFSIVGDLTESLLKRSAGVKDSGTLFPGHGGVLDRIDSLTAAAPVLCFGLHALGSVP
jgi:phosphatidate cytidylyltransferase